MSKRDYEYTISDSLPSWLKTFADNEIKRGGTPVEDIRSILQNNNNLDLVEARVNELKQRVGLDKLAEVSDEVFGGLGDKQPDSKFDKDQLNKGVKVELEHTNNPDLAKEIVKDHLQESKDFKDGNGAKYYDKLEDMEDEIKDELTRDANSRLLFNLMRLANKFSDSNNIKASLLVLNKINKIEKISKKKNKEPKIFEKHEGIKKHIDNICRSRRGHITMPALLHIIKSRAEEIEEEDLDEIKEYILEKIEEEKEAVDRTKDDSIIGLIEVEVFNISEDDKNIFGGPSKI